MFSGGKKIALVFKKKVAAPAEAKELPSRAPIKGLYLQRSLVLSSIKAERTTLKSRC